MPSVTTGSLTSIRGCPRRVTLAMQTVRVASSLEAQAAPRPQRMGRDDGPAIDQAAASMRTRTICCCIKVVDASPERENRPERRETVFYDSAKARRSPLGQLHYCISCPGWNKATSERVVYSKWDMLPLHELPLFCLGGCGCCAAANEATWQAAPAPNTRVFHTPSAPNEGSLCPWQVPCGRQLDTFDAEIVVDASAHQTLCQICRGEGDIVLYRKAGGDLSDAAETYVMVDVVAPLDVFSSITFELSKINLRGAAASAVGAAMGASVWSFDARSGADGPPSGFRGQREVVHYDSSRARRTLLGHACHAECCCGPE